MNVLRITISGDRAPRFYRAQRALGVRRALHQPEDSRARVLEWHVEIRKKPALRGVGGHQPDDLVDVRIGINVVQAHPRAKRAAKASSAVASSVIRVFSGRPFQNPVRYLTSTP